MSDRPDARVAVVDGSNVAYNGEAGPPRLANITRMCEKLTDEGYEPIVLVDAALRHQIDDTDRYEKLVHGGRIRQAPAGTDADYFILSLAREMDGAIVSNDRFKDHRTAFPEAAKRTIRFMIVGDEVVLERRKTRRE